MIKIEDQKQVFNEVEHIYDLVDNLMDILESEDDDNEILDKVNLVQPIIQQMEESATIIGEEYLDFIQANQSSKKSQVKNVETAMRKVFTASTDFINKIKKMPTQEGVVEEGVKNAMAYTNPAESAGMLPVIGFEAGQLIPGEISGSLNSEIKRLTRYSRVILGVRLALDQFFRLTYCFKKMAKGLVQNVNNIIWGRHMPDMKSQAMLEKQRSEDARQALLSGRPLGETHINMINQIRERGII